jgi:hypothetical protein
VAALDPRGRLGELDPELALAQVDEPRARPNERVEERSDVREDHREREGREPIHPALAGVAHDPGDRRGPDEQRDDDGEVREDAEPEEEVAVHAAGSFPAPRTMKQAA